MTPVTRRRFLGAVAGAVAGAGLVRAAESAGSPVWVSRADASEAIPRLLDAVPAAKRLLVPGARVVVKPNISWPNPPAWATTTSPDVVGAVVRYCLQRGAASVVVVDNPLGDSARCVERTGISAALDGLTNARLSLPSRPRDFVPRPLPSGSALPQVEIARELLPATCIINLPKAKAHSATAVSFGLKNLMGLVADRQVFHRGGVLHKAIAELLHAVRPHLTVLDATTVLTSRGPQGPGTVVDPGLIGVAEDPVAIDAYACTVARWDGRTLAAKDVPHLSHAEALGLGKSAFEIISV